LFTEGIGLGSEQGVVVAYALIPAHDVYDAVAAMAANARRDGKYPCVHTDL
jgi:hypothetical protein